MKQFCWGCQTIHEAQGWKGKTIEIAENKTKFVWFCDKWYKISYPKDFTRSIPHKQKIEWDQQKHAKDNEQPWVHTKKGWKTNPKFVKMYKDEPEILDRYFDKDEQKKAENDIV